MAEPTLGINFAELKQSVGRFLGYGSSESEWTAEERSTIEDIVQSGYRQFLYLPSMEGMPIVHEWSFLKPTVTLTTTADQADDDLPDNFGRIIGSLTFPTNEGWGPVLADVGEARIRMQRQGSNQTGRPLQAAVRIVSAGAEGQRRQIMWWPTPDAVYSLTCRYEAQFDKLTEASPYPLGGAKHAETIRESCLAAAELHANDEIGIHRRQFESLAMTSVKRDKREGTQFFGNPNGGGTEYVRSYTLRVGQTVIQ